MCALLVLSRARRGHRFFRRASATWTVIVSAAALTLSACGGPERTGTSFCRQVARELPAIGQRMATPEDVRAMVGRYERLLERAPLEIEADVRAVVELLQLASKVDAQDAEKVQELADKTYATNQAANSVRAWVQDTCAVDIATGALVEPARTIPPTTVPVDTPVAPETTAAPEGTVAPATTVNAPAPTTP